MRTLILLLFPFIFLGSSPPSSLSNIETHLNALYYSLDPTSISELFAFYHLYPNSPQGQHALIQAWDLINMHRPEKNRINEEFMLPDMDIQAIIALANKDPYQKEIALSPQQLSLIESIANHLVNRKLKGYFVWDKEETTKLLSEEIDLARALLLYQFEDKQSVRQYEASLDLMALQILAKLPKEASNEEKINAINDFIFYEKKFRFPPHSLHVKDIDLYTLLPSVLDNRQGVCLGVSILYLSLAQRLNLPLEIITPPGHIYLSYTHKEKIINIETTARGISLPSKVYLGINTYKLHKRTIKEVVGMAFMNQASTYWQRNEYEQSIKLYEKARLFQPNDPLLLLFLSYNHLFLDKIKKGKQLLKKIEKCPFEGAIYPETTPEDFLRGYVDIEGIKTIYLPVDETRESILEKQKKLLLLVKKFPRFRDGLFHLAVTYLQLHRYGEALAILQKYHQLDSNNPTVEYYLAFLCMDRLQYKKAWLHLKIAENILSKKTHYPESLKAIRHQLRCFCIDPNPNVDQIEYKKESL